VLTDNGMLSAGTAGAPGGTTWFVEPLWHSDKYEEVHLRAYDSVSEAVRSVATSTFIMADVHMNLDGVTPEQAYFNSLPLRLPA
jgi:putative transposase